MVPFCPVVPLPEFGAVRDRLSSAPLVSVFVVAVVFVVALVVGCVVTCVSGIVVTAVVCVVAGMVVAVVVVLFRALVRQPERSIAISATAQTI